MNNETLRLDILKNGGYAYPFEHFAETPNSGMTLRDAFAKDVAGMIALDELRVEGGFNAETVARDAYRLADAMLAERVK